LLYYRNLVRALDDGMTRVDWGAGDSGYKRVIGAAAGPAIRDWLFVRPGLPGLAARLARPLWRRSGNRSSQSVAGDLAMVDGDR
jgi:CelD/BcsL family acetyltransferase involved in cellulose biosynthesis